MQAIDSKRKQKTSFLLEPFAMTKNASHSSCMAMQTQFEATLAAQPDFWYYRISSQPQRRDRP
jgi:hypothetical protein